MFRALRFICVAILAVSWSSIAVAQEPAPNPFKPEFLLDMGYANISLGSGSSLDSEGGLRLAPTLSFSPIPQLPQLRLGADLGITLVLDNSSRTVVYNDGRIAYFGTSDIPLWTLEPEVAVSWRQNFGPYFIEPGIAGGGLFGFLNLRSENGNETTTYSADSSTGYGRVFLRAGMDMQGLIWGFDGSYLSGGTLNFGGTLSGHVTEWYVGLFAALRF